MPPAAKLVCQLHKSTTKLAAEWTVAFSAHRVGFLSPVNEPETAAASAIQELQLIFGWNKKIYIFADKRAAVGRAFHMKVLHNQAERQQRSSEFKPLQLQGCRKQQRAKNIWTWTIYRRRGERGGITLLFLPENKCSLAILTPFTLIFV